MSSPRRNRATSGGSKDGVMMTLFRAMLIWSIVWYWIYYPGPGGGWQREGPYVERSYCERRAQALQAAGIPARCVREG
jgi:hypothetical protein